MKTPKCIQGCQVQELTVTSSEHIHLQKKIWKFKITQNIRLIIFTVKSVV